MQYVCKFDFAAHGVETVRRPTKPKGGACYICLQAFWEQHPLPHGESESSSQGTGSASTGIDTDANTTGTPSDASTPTLEHETDADEVIRTVACGHSFHRVCLFAWLPTSPTCPQCRLQLYDPEGEKLARAFFVSVLRRLEPRFRSLPMLRAFGRMAVWQYVNVLWMSRMLGVELRPQEWWGEQYREKELETEEEVGMEENVEEEEEGEEEAENERVDSVMDEDEVVEEEEEEDEEEEPVDLVVEDTNWFWDGGDEWASEDNGN